jgi:aspartyl-tRNA(Asn)/glutamyl-tRNA(Gln) amidotransferase subunit A
MYLQDIFTVHPSLAGTPAISLPLFNHDESGLPYGVQFMAKAFGESRLLDFCQNLMPSKALKNNVES